MGKIKKMITGAAVTFLCGMAVFVSGNTCLAAGDTYDTALESVYGDSFRSMYYDNPQKACLKRVILETSGTLVKPQNSLKGLELWRKVSKSWSVGMEKIRWIIKAHRKACKGYLRVLLVDA